MEEEERTSPFDVTEGRGGDLSKKVEGGRRRSCLPAFTRKFTNRGQGEKKIWQQAVSLVPNIEQLRSIARRFFGCQKWWRARHARKPFSPFERRAKNRTPPLFSSEFEAERFLLLDDAYYFTNGTRRISLKRIGKSTIPRFNKHSFLSFSNFLVELIKAFAPIFLSLSLFSIPFLQSNSLEFLSLD